MSVRGRFLKRGVMGRAFAWALVGLLAVGLPGTGVTLAAGREAAPAALTIGSDPVGASVYVDGKIQGQTPLVLDAVASGDHQVKVVKDGYLENSRVVTVQPGLASSVRINLTPTSTARMQVEPGTSSKKKSGGTSSLVYIIPAVAVAGVGGYLLLKPKNKPPVVGGVTVGPAGVVGIPAVTEFQFTAQGASDPDNDPLTITWDFGDGGGGSGANATHVYTREGTFNVVVTVSDGKLSVTANGSATVRSLSGGWTINFPEFSNTFPISLNQSGTSITGTSNAGPVAGSVRPPRNVQLRFTDFCDTLDGTVNNTATEITGADSCGGGSSTPFRMTR
jgi:hypothetical protein